MIFPTQLATIFAFIAVLQDCASAATVTRQHERGSLERRQSAGFITANCGNLLNRFGEFGGQCVCYNPDTVAILGTTPGVIEYSNANGLSFPSAINGAGQRGCVFPRGPLTLPNEFNNCCSYTCDFGPCGEGESLVCLNQGEICRSGVPVPSSATRRSLAGRECPAGLTSCAVEFTGGRQYYECLDTQKDLESCGGCMNPDPRYNGLTSSGTFGMDCSAIPDASDVACVKGQCVVSACERGYELVDGACVEKDNGITAQQLLRMINGFA